jgi:hypothetical protein
LNTGSFYNIATNTKYAAYLSTNFILNNSRRNQIVGSVSFSAADFSINYYNDGAQPFNLFALADNFDRWWTGGFGVYIHNHKNYNVAELSFVINSQAIRHYYMSYQISLVSISPIIMLKILPLKIKGAR